MGMGDQPRCRDCNVPIMFVTSSSTGRTMVLDPYPVGGGNVQLRKTAEGLVADVLSKAKVRQMVDQGRPTYRVHQASCEVLHPPDAEDDPDVGADQLQLLAEEAGR